MRIVHGYRELDPSDRGASVAIGNFDGVHLGHQALIRDAAEQARSLDTLLGVVSFEPHPRQFFQPDASPFRLTSLSEKARILSALGVDRLYVLPFISELSNLSAEAFLKDVLAMGLGVTHLVAGADFRFGKKRGGDTALLRAMGPKLGFGVKVHELIGDESGDFASTGVRELIAAGDCPGAAKQLGRWPTIAGEVIKGDQRGRDLGYPTANLAFGDQLCPSFGVYATWVDVLSGPNAGRHAGVASIGERPTFGVNAPNFEVHLFDFSGDLYGTEISVSLVERLRGEERFDGIEPLIAQMDRDSVNARAILENEHEPWKAA